MVKKISIANATGTIIEITKHANKPVIIAVYGLQHHGKNYLAERFRGEYASDRSTLVMLTNGPEYLPRFREAGYYFVLTTQTPEIDITDVIDRQILKHSGKLSADLHVLIYNPTLYEPDLGRCDFYDLIIENRH